MKYHNDKKPVVIPETDMDESLDGQTSYCLRCEHPLNLDFEHTCVIPEGVYEIGSTGRLTTNHSEISSTLAECTCASFYTVRGVHKKDCPMYLTKGDERRKFYQMGYDEGFKDGENAKNEPKTYDGTSLREEWEKSKKMAYLLECPPMIDKADLMSVADWFITKFHTDLIAIADAGEYEDMRREVERYFKNI